jgi:molybdate transport system substrate-binding protein
MQALAESSDERPIGCTQVTEILHTSGVRLVGPLPPGFELATTYVAAVAADAADPDGARDFVERLTGAASAELRRACGFDARG